MTRTWPEDWDARKRGVVECGFCVNQPYFGTPFYVGGVGDAHLERHAIARGHVIVIFSRPPRRRLYKLDQRGSGRVLA